MLHLLSFHNTPHSVPASQIDSFQNITIKVHYEINSLAATGNGGGSVLASATAHVAESQHAPSLYYHPSPAYKQVLYRTISNSKRILILLGKYSKKISISPR